jgi:signal peptidase I
VAFRAPQRGDVIVFNNPVRPDLDYIKRVVAVGGDTLELKGRQIIVNGVAAPQEVVEPSFQHWEKGSTEGLTWGQWVQSWFVNDWFQRQAVLIRESIDGQPHWILHERGPSPSYEGVVQVPPGHVFVMGDNRDESQDSRLGLGGGYRGGDQPTLTNNGRVEFVPVGNIKGKAMVIWLSNAHGGPLSDIFGGTGLRLDRFFEPIARCGGEPPPVQP